MAGQKLGEIGSQRGGMLSLRESRSKPSRCCTQSETTTVAQSCAAEEGGAADTERFTNVSHLKTSLL